MSLDFRRATRADLPGIVQMIADDQIGQKREDASVPLNPAYLAAFEAILAGATKASVDGEMLTATGAISPDWMQQARKLLPAAGR